MNNEPTVLVLALDAVGVPTLEHLLRTTRHMPHLPELARMGLGNILQEEFRGAVPVHEGRQFSMAVDQASASADSVVGHREMFGIVDPRTYELFGEGFPQAYVRALEERIGRSLLFNRQAGGMEAIELNWQEHERRGAPILYASKCDPLLQIAMNEEIIPIVEQHRIGDEAFALAQEMGVQLTRVITRPYTRNGTVITRTPNRHDICLPLEADQQTLIDLLYARGTHTVAIGKTSDLVPSRYHDIIKLTGTGSHSVEFQFVHPAHKDANPYSLQGTLDALRAAGETNRPHGTLIVTNLVDTDSLWGHTREVEGALRSLEETDRAIGIFQSAMRKGDYLIVTADHGMEHRADYGYHRIEPLPFLAHRIGERTLGGMMAGCGKTLADVGYMISQIFGVTPAFVKACGLERFYGRA